MRINKRLHLIYLLALASILSIGAQNVMTPYSRFGYGMLNDNSTSTQRAMGGVGYAMNSGRQINVKNPASYAMMDSLTFLFDMGMDLTQLWQSEQTTSKTEKAKQFGGGLDYITMQVPITKGLGASAGLLPYSGVGYNFGDAITNGSQARSGTGGFNLLYIGAGWNPFAGLAFGANFSYMFGDVTNQAYAYTQSGTYSLFQHTLTVRDWHLDLGLQYTIKLNQEDRMVVGLSFSPKHDLHGDQSYIAYDVSHDEKPDTAYYGNLKGGFSLPNSYGAGISYEWKRRLFIEADFLYQEWSKAKCNTLDIWDKTIMDNRWRAALGVQYQPDSRGNYLKRTCYRVGGYFNHDYLKIKGNYIKEIGLTCGLGLPIPGYKTTVNLGVEYIHRQASPNPLIKENYLNISLGVNFNEMWFWRNKLH